MSEEVGKLSCAAAAIVVIVFLFLTGWFVKSYFEAASYSRVTGANVSTWDAMWIELRVQEQPKSRDEK